MTKASQSGRCYVVSLAAALALAWPFGVAAGEEAVIDIAALLEPATQMRAFQEFTLKESPVFKELGLGDLAQFAEAYPEFRVLRSREASPDLWLYVAISSERTVSSTDAYPTVNANQLFHRTAPAGTVFPPARSHSFTVFDANGNRVFSDSIRHGVIQDLTADGSLEILAKDSSGEISVRDLRGRTLFASPCRLKKENGRATWAWLLQPSVAGNGFDLVLGPRREGAIIPKVVHRWQPKAKTWDLTNDGTNVFPSDLFPPTPTVDNRPATREDAPPEITIVQSPIGGFSGRRAEQLLPDQISRAYRHQSLAGLTPAELLRYFAPGRDVYDLERAKAQTELPPSFWRGEPRAAALEFVRLNRPDEAVDSYMLAVDDLDGRSSPEEGTVTLSDGPSGCFSPPGGYEYFLKCSKSASYFVAARSLSPWFMVDPLEQNACADLRLIPVTYLEARQLLRTVWWLNRVRSLQVGDSVEGGSLGSTSDGSASFVLHTTDEDLEVSGTRFAMHPGTYAGVGETTVDYTKTACLNLVVKLICWEFPKYLGGRWRQLDVYKNQPLFEVPSLGTQYSPGRLTLLKETVRQVLKLSIAGELSWGATREAIAMATDLNFTEILPELETIAATLPPPAPAESRLVEIEEEIRNCRRSLGEEGSQWRDYFARENAELLNPIAPPPLPPVPGLESNPPAEPAPAPAPRVKHPPDPKFAAIDALYAEQSALHSKLTHGESALRSLRAEVGAAQLWFAVQSDPDKLYEQAIKDENYLFAACRRLRQLAPDRGIAALEHWAGAAKEPTDTQRILKAIDDLRTEIRITRGEEAESADTLEIRRLAGLKPGAEAKAEAEGLMAVAADMKRDLNERGRALALLVPVANPGKFEHPEIEPFLVRLFRSEEEQARYLVRSCAEALALRSGGKYWDLLVNRGREPDQIGMPEMHDILPSLVRIVCTKGEPYRTRLRDLLLPEFEQTHGFLNRIIWTAWVAELRDLKPAIEKVATGSFDEVEGTLGESLSNHPSPVRHHLHAARQVAALWNEEDKVTRAKLLIALSFQPPTGIAEEMALERLRTSLASTIEGLSRDEHMSVVSFLEWSLAQRSAESHSANEDKDWLLEAKAILTRTQN